MSFLAKIEKIISLKFTMDDAIYQKILDIISHWNCKFVSIDNSSGESIFIYVDNWQHYWSYWYDILQMHIRVETRLRIHEN
jgi:hypothetical protein